MPDDGESHGRATVTSPCTPGSTSYPPPEPVLLAGFKDRGAGAAIVSDKPTGPYNRTGAQGPLDPRAGSKVLGGGWSKGPLLDGFIRKAKTAARCRAAVPNEPKPEL